MREARRPGPDGTNVPPTGGLGGGGGGGGMPHFLAEIGVLEVGANGVGQAQNQFAGMQVHSLAGLTVMVVSPNANANAAATGSNPRTAGVGQNEQNGARRGNANRLRDGAVVNPQTGAPMDMGSNSGLGPVAMGVIRLVEGAGLPQQPSNNPDDIRHQQSLEDADRIRDEAQQRDLTTPPDQTFDPNQRPAAQ